LLISYAGREVLIKASVATVPSFAMGVGLLSKTICREMEDIMRNFYWDSTRGAHACFLGAKTISKYQRCSGSWIQACQGSKWEPLLEDWV